MRVASPETPVPPGDRPLTRLERAGAVLLVLGSVLFGAAVVVRSAYQQSRKTDFGVYARAADAVRAGRDIYAPATCDDNGWHYCYPPPFAILMVPLADPFPWDSRASRLPFGASVALWYLLSVTLIWVSADVLARVALPDAVPGSRRWWYARTVPILACVGGAGATLSRGQVNTLAVALVVMMFANLVRNRPCRAGAWLAAAAALKVFPAFLAVYPLVRGRWRSGVGFFLGLGLLLVGLPSAVWGFEQSVRYNRVFADAVLLPGLGLPGDPTRGKELTEPLATASQSFRAVVQNLRNPDAALRARTPADPPPPADPVANRLHWALGGLMLLVTVAVGLRRATAAVTDQLLLFGCFCAVMVHLTPVSHPHYYFFAFPLAAGLWCHGAARRPGRAGPGRATVLALAAWGLATGLILLPDALSSAMRVFGGGVAATLGLWAFALSRLGRPVGG